VPPKVISAARKYLHDLERHSSELHAPRRQQELQLDLPRDVIVAEHPAVDALANINPDELTPKQALDALYKLRALIQ